MPRVAIAAQAIGAPIVWTAASASNHSFARPSAAHLLLVQNTGIADHTITVITPGTAEGNAIADKAIVITAGKIVPLAAFSDLYIDKATGLISVDVVAGDIADLNFALLLIGQG